MRFRNFLSFSILLTFLFAGVKDKKSELYRTKQRLKKVKQELKSLEKEKKNILKKLNLLDEKEKLTEKLLLQLGMEERSVIEEIKVIEEQVRTIKERIEILKGDVEKFIVSYYLYKRFYRSNIFNFNNPSEYFRRIVLLKRFTIEDRKKIEDYMNSITQLKEKQMYLEERISYLTSVKKEKEEDYYSLIVAKKEKKQEIAKIEREKKKKEKLRKELIVAQRRLQNLIASMEKKRKQKQKTGIKEKFYVKGKGTLDWPCRGKIVAPFGTVKDPRYGTKIKNQGIDIRCSGSVKAVQSGSVVFSDRYLGYENMVIIYHGKGFYSVYAYLDAVKVKKGQKIKKGEVIGSCKDVLHFEWRINAKSVNPLKWLK